MYLQITTRCNMRCPHCMFSCTERGRDMSIETVKAACRFTENEEEDLFIGGGEPTLHPQFWEILGLVMASNSAWACSTGTPPVGVVTNGRNAKDAIRLAQLAESGAIMASLSRDQYHEDIEERVVRAFTKSEMRRQDPHDFRDLRGRISRVRGVGRGRNFEGPTPCDDCSLLIAPTGTVWRCSCRRESLGNIRDPSLCINWDLIQEPGCTRGGRHLFKDPEGTWRLKERSA